MPTATAGSLVRLRFPCREVGLRSNPVAPASPSAYSQHHLYARIHSHGVIARREMPFRRFARDYGSTAVILRFGTCPTGICISSLRVATSITLTEFDPALAT